MATAGAWQLCHIALLLAQVPSMSERLIVSGPYIQLLGYEPDTALWRASVMALAPPAQGSVLTAEPGLHVYDQGAHC